MIYRSQYFVKFFEDASSPKDESPLNEDSSLENSIISQPENEEEEEGEEDEKNDNNSIEEDVLSASHNTLEQLSSNDYLYDAALSFSQAVQEEANLRYKAAFDLYKEGIDKLLTGAKNDTNEKRKRIAKTKAQKYLEKAEQLYENHILLQQENEFFIEDADDNESQTISSLERPFSNMSKYKVIQVNERIMHVQDCTDKKMYVIKVIWKSHTNRILFMPQKIPYMMPLLSYFTTNNNAIFLLLPFVSGGLLWNYVKSYSPVTTHNSQIEELFVEPPEERKENSQVVENPLEIRGKIINNPEDVEIQEEAFEALDEIDSGAHYQESSISLINDDDQTVIPSFDTLSTDIDIDDLMKVSQKLLQSVTKTLEKSVIISTEINEDETDANEEEKNKENVNSIKTIEKKSSNIDEREVTITKSIAPLPEVMIKRWSAEIIVAVNCLHKNGIILGDLNLDNILLGHDGKVVLTYFHQHDRNSFQQLCFLNSRAIKNHYVAFDFPLTKKSDYYSIGVIIYEIITQSRFYVNHPGGISKFNEIQYPEHVNVSLEAKDLIQNLILSVAAERFSFDELKEHKFFSGINFDEIEKSGVH